MEIKTSYKDHDIASWHKHSPETSGLHHVVNPKADECNVASIYRLNLKKGETFNLSSKDEEMNGVVTKGEITLKGALEDKLIKLDSFYIPGKTELAITANEDTSIYIGAAVCEGYGKPFIRHIDFSLPVGDIHQIHGSGSGQREVMFTLAPQDSASRLICGLTWSADGQWTSWPPHQHEKDLEEVYCYFDMEKYGFHFSYTTDQKFSDAYSHIITDGSMVQAPVGYHPTCAIPGSKNVYLWVLASHSHSQRSYELAKPDPELS